MRMVDFKNCHPFSKILAISVPSVAFMCPLMSLAATILFKDAGNQFVAVWLQTTAFNFPMAFFWQLPHESGTLYNMLSHIIYNGLNMTKIESRPIPGKSWEYRFFVDFTGKLGESAVENALRGIEAEANVLRVLGNY